VDAGKIPKFQEHLLNWYRNHARVLPWRTNPNPYRIWISEIMLQQTQVKTVVPYYSRFIARFPDVASLAKASEQEVLALWSGLGYYNRARNLRKSARRIVKKKGGFPAGFGEILALPGIGRYTAGAICAIAYNQAQPAVDGNIRRVIARLMRLERAVPETWFYNQVTALIPPREASSFTQAMMDLGAVVCTPVQPACPRCPVEKFCMAKKLGIQDRIPPSKTRQARKRIRVASLVLERSSKILVTSPVSPNFIPGRLGLPSRLLSALEKPRDAAVRLCRKILGKAVPLASCARFRHSIGHRQILVYGFCGEASVPLSRMLGAGNFRWAHRSSTGALLTSSLFKKVVKDAEKGWGDSRSVAREKNGID
jgi:A/G-specific adenine glycosylase